MPITLWNLARGFVHDMQALAALDEDRPNVLLVSDRTLSILQNLAAVDIAFLSRYAAAVHPFYYEYPDPDSSDAIIVRSWVTQLQEELMPVNWDVKTGLDDVAAAISELAAAIAKMCSGGGGAGCGAFSSNAPLAPCTAALTPDELNPPTPPDMEPPYEGDPPSGFATWDEYLAFKCNAAWTLVRLMETFCDTATGLAGLQLVSAIVVPIVAGYAGILPVALSATGFVGLIAAIVAIGGISVAAIGYFQQVKAYIVAQEEDLVCALFNSAAAADAIIAIADVCEDAIQAIAWGELAPLEGLLAPLFGEVMSQFQTNSFVLPLFELVTSIQTTPGNCDCSLYECNQPRELLEGVGDVSGIGPRTITLSYRAENETWYARVVFEHGICIKCTDLTGFTPDELDTDFIRAHHCPGEPTVDWSYDADMTVFRCCEAYLSVYSKTAASFTLDIEDYCVGTGECP